MVLLLAEVWILEGTGEKIDERKCPLYLCEEYVVNAAEQLEIVGWNLKKKRVKYRRGSSLNVKMYYRVVINRLG